MKKYFGIAFVVICAGVLCSQPSWREQVGRQPDGTFLLSNGWSLQPAGKQIPLDTLPMSVVPSKDGKFLLVLNGGYKPPSIIVLSAADMHEVSRVPLPDAWLGLAISPDGTHVYASGGSRATVYEFMLSSDGALQAGRELVVVPEAQREWEDFIGDVAVSPDGHSILAADMYRDSIVAIDAQSGRVTGQYKTGRRPYRILFHPDGKSFFVSSWADGTVYLHDAASGEQLGRIRVAPHPTDMVLSNRKPEGMDDAPAYRLFVAAANTNSVFAIGVSGSNEMKMLETLNVALTPMHPLGMTPSAVALSPDQSKLLRGLLGRERGRGRGYLRGAQPRHGIYSDGLVSDGGARVDRRARAGVERPRPCKAIRIRTTPDRDRFRASRPATRGAITSATCRPERCR